MKPPNYYKARKFAGDEPLAIKITAELQTIENSIHNIEDLVKQNMEHSDGVKILRALANSYGEILTEIEMPIKAKFPDIDT